MSDVNLGQAPGYGAERDAVHVSVLPLTADSDLEPGERVGILNGRYANKHARHCAIVDPFREGTIKRYEMVWVLMLPGEVSGLRHHWSHPEVEEPTSEPEEYDGCKGCW